MKTRFLLIGLVIGLYFLGCAQESSPNVMVAPPGADYKTSFTPCMDRAKAELESARTRHHMNPAEERTVFDAVLKPCLQSHGWSQQ